MVKLSGWYRQRCECGHIRHSHAGDWHNGSCLLFCGCFAFVLLEPVLGAPGTVEEAAGY